VFIEVEADLSRRGNTQIATNLPRKEVTDFCVAWNARGGAGPRIEIERVPSSFA